VSARIFWESRSKARKSYLRSGGSSSKLENKGSPGVEDAKRVGRRRDWVPAEVESPALATMGKAEIEERVLVRFTLFTALRERRVTPREVSIVLDGDENNDNYGENVWMCVGERIRSEQCEILLIIFRHRFNSDNTRLSPAIVPPN
jgi:hypothetical protein